MMKILNVWLLMSSRVLSAALYLLISGVAVWPLSAGAMLISELEPNDTRVAATLIPGAAFDFASTGGLAFRNATNDPAAPPFPTAGLLGRNSTISDVDFFSFTGFAGEKIYIDADNDPAILCPTPCNFDGALVLFNSVGAILAIGDSTVPADLGLIFDPFIGVFTLPATDTYFLAVASGPLMVNFSPGSTFTPLSRPNGLPAGFAVNGSADNRDQFGPGQSSGGYLVWVSRSGPSGSVPEPGMLALLGVAFAVMRMIRRPSTHT